MADAMVVDDSAPPSTAVVKSLKRKREKQKVEVCLTKEERDLKIKTLNEEVESLIKYFNEVLSCNFGLGFCSGEATAATTANLNAVTAVLLEEKRWSFTRLVEEVYEKAKERDGDGGGGSGGGITNASVKASVLFVGQRVAYGVPIADADVLEDVTESCLWCWETRDLKLLPKSVRGAIKIRRTFRKKINERILAILDAISSLKRPEDHPSYKLDAAKAAVMLSKVLSEADIRLLMESLAQKNGSEMAGTEVKKNEAVLIKELEKNKREAEKEKKRIDRELLKEKLQSEKEQKRLQQEAEKDEKRREKEEFEMRKQLKRKQEDAEREQRRREKEEADLKKQLAVQKQASIMERFLKRSKTTASQNVKSESIPTSDSDVTMKESISEAVSLLMDSALKQTFDIDVEEIWKSHVNSWHRLGHVTRSKKQHWGMRHKPKTELIKELKLTANKGPSRDDDLGMDIVVDGWGEINTDTRPGHENRSASSDSMRKSLHRKQLLQFDKSPRPAFYGIWPKKSTIVRPRNPLKKDPDLDYDIDSDEEWEEEDPGESLSDSEKEEEENLDEGSCKADDEEESEDGFFVPDGYLSENEGVDTDRNQSKIGEEVTPTSPRCKSELESEESSAWFRRQKYLHNLTEHALKKNQPLIIINLMHEKTNLLSSENLSGTPKAEQICLLALSMQAFQGGLPIEVPSNCHLPEEGQEVSTSNSKGNITMTGVATAIPDSDLPLFVSAIQSYPQGINRVLECLQQRLPDIPKTHMRNKIREISEFVDNRWKVKKEILDKLGMSAPPDKTRAGTKKIAAFFSKRCLPPSGQVINPCESSPESVKPSSSSQQRQQRESTENV